MKSSPAGTLIAGVLAVCVATAGAAATTGAATTADGAITAAAPAAATAATLTSTPGPRGSLPPIRHVFILLLENQSFGVTFAHDSLAPYLAHTLTGQGALLTQYYGIGHWSLPNYLALISGQAPNSDTQADCPALTEFQLTRPKLDSNGQALGSGCIYPAVVKTLAEQLEAAKLTWKGYMEDMGNDPTRERATCGHSPLGADEHTHAATAIDKYAARHDPFVYFHSILDDQARCDAHVVNLEKLPADLGSVATTPNYSFITPNLCNDGHDANCVDGKLGGFRAIDAFLRKWVPLITASSAFQKDGILIITFDESDGRGPEAATSCCSERGLPGEAQPPGIVGPGGGRVGAVLLSRFIKPGTVSDTAYNHYSTLRFVEDLFGLQHLGYAGQKGLPEFGADVFTQP